MNVKERLFADLKQAMRDRDTVRREALRMARSAVQYAEIELQRDATDEEVLAIIGKEVKTRREAIVMFRQGGRQDLVVEEEAGVAVLESYLPRQLSRDAIEQVVQRIVEELGLSGPKGLGVVMKTAMAELQGRADGKIVNEVARAILNN